MNKRRKLLVALGAGALTVPFGSFAQQAKVYRIGVLLATSAGEYKGRIDALWQGLNELGYSQGSNVILKMRFAEGNQERLPRSGRRVRVGEQYARSHRRRRHFYGPRLFQSRRG